MAADSFAHGRKVRIPHGLGAILEQLTAAILKEQPPKIRHFAVTFFEKLIEERNQSKVSQHSFRKDSAGTSRLPAANNLPRTSIVSSMSTSKSASKESTNFLEDTSRLSSPTNSDTGVQSLKPLESEKSIIITPRFRQSVQDSKVSRESPVKIFETPELTSKTKSQLDEDEAALRIQAAYRGYRTRRSLQSNPPLHDVADREDPLTPRADQPGREKQTESLCGDTNASLLLLTDTVLGPEQTEHKNETSINDTVMIDKAFDDILRTEEVLDNDEDEEEIWKKLQRDISLDEADKHQAVIKIQACARGYLTRKQLKKQRSQSNSQRPSEVSETYEALTRENLEPELSESRLSQEAEPDFLNLVNQDELVNEDFSDVRNKAAVTIQAHTRGYLTRKHLKQQKEAGGSNSEVSDRGETEKLEEDNLPADEENAAVKIQARVRGHLTRKHLKEQAPAMNTAPDVYHDEPTDLEEVREHAAIKIQAHARGYLTRKHLKEERKNLKEENLGNTDELDQAKETADLNEADLQTKAAIKIQAEARGFLTRKKLAKEREMYSGVRKASTQGEANQAANNDRQTQAAVKIQAQVRGYLTRKHLLEERQASPSQLVEESPLNHPSTNSEEDDMEKEVERKAAVTIQAHARGYLTRKHLKEARQINPSAPMKESPLSHSLDSEEVDDRENEAKNKAAVTIQAHARGYLTRKHLKETKEAIPAVLKEENHSDISSGSLEEVCDGEDEVKNKAAVKIQAHARGYLTRKHLKEAREETPLGVLEENRLSPSLENSEEVDEIESEVERKAAVTIQAHARGHITRKHLKKARLDTPSVLMEESPLNHTFGNLEEVNEMENEAKRKAAVTIQAHARGYLTRKHLKEERQATPVRLKEENPLNHSFENSEEVNEMENEAERKAAVTIQAHARGYLTRKHLKEVREATPAGLVEENPLNHSSTNSEEIGGEEDEARRKAAVTIQAHARGYLTRKHLKEAREATPSGLAEENPLIHSLEDSEEVDGRENEVKNKAAVTIQAHTRGYLTRKHLRDSRQTAPTDPEEENGLDQSLRNSGETEGTEQEEEKKAAIKIQAHVKGYLTRKHVQELRHSQTSEDRSVDNEEDIQTQAAIKLQAHTRGYLTRKHLRDQSKEREVVQAQGDATCDTLADEQKRSNAAVKIQAHYRGYRTRKQLRFRDSKPSDLADGHRGDRQVNQKSADEELRHKAATTIQARVRGHLVRKHLRNNSISVSKKDFYKDLQQLTSVNGDVNEAYQEVPSQSETDYNPHDADEVKGQMNVVA